MRSYQQSIKKNYCKACFRESYTLNNYGIMPCTHCHPAAMHVLSARENIAFFVVCITTLRDGFRHSRVPLFFSLVLQAPRRSAGGHEALSRGQRRDRLHPLRRGAYVTSHLLVLLLLLIGKGVMQ